MSDKQQTSNAEYPNTIAVVLDQLRHESHGSLFTARPLHLEKKQDGAKEKSKHAKAEHMLNQLLQNNDGREFPVPHSGTRIHGTGQLSSTPLFLYEKIDYGDISSTFGLITEIHNRLQR